MTDSPLSRLTPFPAAIDLDPAYDRHAPAPDALRRTLSEIAAARDWAAADWPELISGLLAIGRTDVPLSRLAEGHIDALRILAQAGSEPVPGALYGVWASRSQQSGVRGRERGEGLVLDGTIRFASGAGVLDRALVPVWLDADRHVLVDLAVDRQPVDSSQWATTAMEVSRSHSVALDAVTVGADARIGPIDFYLARPGFFPGGVGVAACWAGGAARIVDLCRARSNPPTPAQQPRLGRMRIALASAGALVHTAAHRLAAMLAVPDPDPHEIQAVSTETRAGVGAAVEVVLTEALRVAGPAGLAFDRDLTRAVHDLQLYVLQQNADADERFLGGPDPLS